MTTVENTLRTTEVGKETVFRSLTLFPLLSREGYPSHPGYLTLDEALAQQVARITEVSPGGSVPDLKFTNDADLPVLLLDGEELVGAKQNRVLNLTVLVPAKTALLIPVSCVEAGRWSATSAEFDAAPRAHYAAGRALKTVQVSERLHKSGTRHADQGAIWADIEEKAARLASPSPTQAMAAMYEQHGDSLEDYVAAFQAAPGQVGALFTIRGRIVGFDRFDHPATLTKLLFKLVRSYALDALDAPSKETPVSSAGCREAEAFLRAVAAAPTTRFSAIGMGEDIRFSSRELAGAALVAAERVVHANAFAVREAGQIAEKPGAAARLSRSSLRRARHR